MTPPSPLARTLVPIFAVQFFSWAGMFCMWIYVVPVIAGQVFHGGADPALYSLALAAVGGCYALYAILGASLAFVLPRALDRYGVRLVYGLALAISACGIASLGVITRGLWLVPAFLAIGVGWCCMANIPYGVVSAVAPEGRGAHLMRVFAFSTVAPQISMTLLLALVSPRLNAATTHWVMLAGGALMATAALVALMFGGRFAVTAQEW